MAKPTHLYTIFTQMMTHYYHFHQQNSPSLYHHRNKGSLIYLEQFQNRPIGIPKLMKMHLKTFEHPCTPCFREYPPGVVRWGAPKSASDLHVHHTQSICTLHTPCDCVFLDLNLFHNIAIFIDYGYLYQFALAK